MLREAEKLVAAGTKELLVISQDTSAYGVDIRHEERMWKGHPVRAHMTDLARELGQLRTPEGEVPWVRLHYVYPYPHVDAVIPLMAEGLLTPYLDIPFQHASPKVLRAMKRPANEAKVLERLKAWREIVPEITIRSSFVVGFPGETEEDFQYLLDWLDEAQLDRVGAFRFEPVAGAAANALPDPVPEAVKEERYARIMELTERISAAKLAAKVGRTLPVIIDEVGEPDEDGDIGATGRSQADAPEIDGQVFLRNVPASLKPGDIVEVRDRGRRRARPVRGDSVQLFRSQPELRTRASMMKYTRRADVPRGGPRAAEQVREGGCGLKPLRAQIADWNIAGTSV